MSSRRSFLKLFGVGTPAVALTAVIGSNATETESNVKKNYLVKEYKKDGINYLEYELPPTVEALFKTPDRKRAIYCPIKVAYSVEEKENLIKYMKNTAMMHLNKDSKYAAKWEEVYIYIVNIEGRQDLFGIMINKSKLELETDVYTVYNTGESAKKANKPKSDLDKTREDYAYFKEHQNSLIDEDDLQDKLTGHFTYYRG